MISKNTGLELSNHLVERYLQRVGSFQGLEKNLRECVLSVGGFSNLRGRQVITKNGVTFVFQDRLVVSAWREVK